MVILIIADTFNGHRGSDLLAEKLLKNNIPTVSIKKDSDLAQELSIFSTKYMINIPESQRFWTK